MAKKIHHRATCVKQIAVIKPAYELHKKLTNEIIRGDPVLEMSVKRKKDDQTVIFTGSLSDFNSIDENKLTIDINYTGARIKPERVGESQKYVSRFLAEKHFGEIPKKRRVWVRNGDKYDFSKENQKIKGVN